MWRCNPTTTAMGFALILAYASSGLAQDFGYGGKHGPEHWSEDYNRCSGKQQSPINIDLVNVEEKEYPPLEFFNSMVSPKAIHMMNNGHTVLVRMSFEDGKEPRVRGGPLAEQAPYTGYQFEQFHFHWGENDTVGSEDLIDNHAYPAELHVVLRNLEYPDFESALGKDHGLAVMAFFFQVRREGTESYEKFTEQLAKIGRKGMSVNITNPMPLHSYLSLDLLNYYTYVGSLTTPPCSEDVIWIDFMEPIDITEKQLNAFRQLTANDEHLNNNFRPIQPLNDRKVYRSVLEPMKIFNQSAIPFVDAANTGERRWSYSPAVLLSSCGLAALLKASAFSGF
ncbi:carbonic anhydrase 2 [Drosophila guanche]|uniref:carbonic anhydrase n=1 Tax=Drosophila guanche TaxID=7266 RepID=A0A3B0J7V3_DROGU|nr:carbonic anhydrase 2 [Drosophila guanche]SPP76273.1 blast:Carbonic anhydrase 2 [Drosophila guanche]